MTTGTIPPKATELLRPATYLSIATADERGQPRVAFKFFLKIEEDTLYVVDMVKGITWRNVCQNPVISLSIMDEEQLAKYQINGRAEILDRGHEFETLRQEFQQEQIRLAVDRVISGVKRLKPHRQVKDLSLPAQAIYKVKAIEIIETGPTARSRSVDLKGGQNEQEHNV